MRGSVLVIEVHPSALRHGISTTSALHAAANCIFISEIDSDPTRELRLDFDEAGRFLELVVLCFDSGNELIIHAMKTRRQYLNLL